MPEMPAGGDGQTQLFLASQDDTSQPNNTISETKFPAKRRGKRKRGRGATEQGENIVTLLEKRCKNSINNEVQELLECFRNDMFKQDAVLTWQDIDAFPSSRTPVADGGDPISFALEYYLSDSNLVHDRHLQHRLGLSQPMTDVAVSPQIEDIIDDHLPAPLLTTLNCWFQSKCKTFGVEGQVDSSTAAVAAQFKPSEARCLLNYLRKTKLKQQQQGIDADGFIWLPAEELVSFPRIQAVHATVNDIVAAATASPVLRVQRCQKKLVPDELVDKIRQFIADQRWDKSFFGSKGAGNIRTPESAEHLVSSTLNGAAALTAVLRLSDEVTHWSKTTDAFRIGRFWGKNRTVQSLAEDINERTIFVENLPLRCTPDHLRALINSIFETPAVVHVSIPRYAVSREIKGFGFVELLTREQAARVVERFHHCWPSLWSSSPSLDNENQQSTPQCSFVAGDEILKYRQRIASKGGGQEKDINTRVLLRRNKRPLTVLYHAQWATRKLANLNVPRENVTQPSFSRNEHFKPVWVEIKNLGCPLTEFAVYQFVASTVSPLRVHYATRSDTASVQLATIEDARRLRTSALLCKTYLGGSIPVEVVLKSCDGPQSALVSSLPTASAKEHAVSSTDPEDLLTLPS